MEKIYSSLLKLNSLQFKYRTLFAFVIVFLFVIFIDILFHINFPLVIDFLYNKYSISISDHESIDLGFAPEIWGGVLAMVLGTLIIVIAIAAESSPKLMDLFVKDWLSLTYVWFLILASLHAVVIMFYVGPLGRVSSVVLNIYVFLFLGSIFTLPYIFYILLYSKTSNVVSTISNIIKKFFIFNMRKPIISSSMEHDLEIVNKSTRKKSWAL